MSRPARHEMSLLRSDSHHDESGCLGMQPQSGGKFCGPPPEFSLASSRSGIVHHLSGPDKHAHTRSLLKRGRSVVQPTKGSHQSTSLHLTDVTSCQLLPSQDYIVATLLLTLSKTFS